MPRQHPKDFFSDLPDDQPPIVKPRPILKEQLTTPDTLKLSNATSGIVSLAKSINYRRDNVSEHAQTVYMLLDDATPQGEEIDPMLGQAYQALTRAAQLLFEAETHLYRYVNKLENQQRQAAAMREALQFIDPTYQPSE